MTVSTRRELLAATALFTLGGSAVARTVTKALPWSPNEAYPASPATPGPFLFLKPAEAEAIDAIVDRLIPADDLGPGAKQAGCTVFIDRQLAGRPMATTTRCICRGHSQPTRCPARACNHR